MQKGFILAFALIAFIESFASVNNKFSAYNLATSGNFPHNSFFLEGFFEGFFEGFQMSSVNYDRIILRSQNEKWNFSARGGYLIPHRENGNLSGYIFGINSLYGKNNSHIELSLNAGR